MTYLDAVLELHKVKLNCSCDCGCCRLCTYCKEIYPCQTIQTIIKELT